MTPYPDIELAPTLYELEATNYPNGTDEGADLHLLGVLAQVADRRHEQDQKWGGPEHDDLHDMLDWQGLLLRRTDDLLVGVFFNFAATEYRDRLLDIAALAVAAAQACDRRLALLEDAADV